MISGPLAVATNCIIAAFVAVSSGSVSGKDSAPEGHCGSIHIIHETQIGFFNHNKYIQGREIDKRHAYRWRYFIRSDRDKDSSGGSYLYRYDFAEFCPRSGLVQRRNLRTEWDDGFFACSLQKIVTAHGVPQDCFVTCIGASIYLKKSIQSDVA